MLIDQPLQRLETPATNAEMRSREYLTPAEIEKVIKAAKGGRWGLRHKKRWSPPNFFERIPLPREH